MKRTTLVFFLFLSASLLLIFQSNSVGTLATNRQQLSTGAPGETTCVLCHSTYQENTGIGTLSMSFSGSHGSYVPNKMYSITVTLTNSSTNKYGFQITSRTGSNVQAGSFRPGAGVDTFDIGGKHYAEHLGSNSTGIFTFNWLSPPTNVGNITFYLTGIVAGGQNNHQGDFAYSDQIVIPPLQKPVSGYKLSKPACIGDSIQLIDTSLRSDNVKWYITGASPSTSTKSNPKFSFSSTGIYQVVLVSFNDAGKDSVFYPIGLEVFDSPKGKMVKTEPSCKGYSNGEIKYDSLVGQPPYSYQWQNGPSSNTFQNLSKGYYCITITDGNGCKQMECDSLLEPDELLLNPTLQNDWGGGNNGYIQTNVTGGTPPYAFNWSNSSTTPAIYGLNSGSYKLTLTDKNGCGLFYTGIISHNVGINENNQTTFEIIEKPGKLLVKSSKGIDAIKVYSLSGRIMAEYQQASQQVEINTSNWPKGLYIIFGDMNGTTAIEKVLLL